MAANLHFVEQTGRDGSYQSAGPDYSHRFDNANDAFWYGEFQRRRSDRENGLDTA